MALYDVGDLVRIAVAFTNPANDDQSVDPDEVTVYYRCGTGEATSLVYGTDDAVEKDGTGAYHLDLSITTSGTWYFRWAGTGVYQSAQEGMFVVRASRFG